MVPFILFNEMIMKILCNVQSAVLVKWVTVFV